MEHLNSEVEYLKAKEKEDDSAMAKEVEKLRDQVAGLRLEKDVVENSCRTLEQELVEKTTRVKFVFVFFFQ